MAAAAASSKNKTTSPDDDDKNIARKAAFGTLVTLVLRLLSFACTQYTFRTVDPGTLGQASIQLELLHSTVLFLSREGFRLSMTRDVHSDKNWNVAWLTVPVSTVISGAGLLWHMLWMSSSSSNTSEDYRRAGMLYCAAACLEGWAEPAVLLSLRQMNVAVKASAEGLATVAKTAATVVLLQSPSLSSSWPVTVFGLAQVLYSVVYFIAVYWNVGKNLVGPRWTNLDPPTCYMTVVFMVQGLFKHALTEADRIVLTALSNTYDQGIYAMGSSYGGLAARLILQPVEESSRLLWSRQASQPPAVPKDKKTDSTGAQDPLEQSYILLVKFVLYVGFMFSFLAVNYTPILLNLLAGRKWGENAEAAAVLSAFCVYTAFLAWNGMTEAFVYGVASTGSEMGHLGVAHTVVGLLFATVAPLAVSRYGTVGLVGANCLAMFCRSVYSLQFAARYFVTRSNKATGHNESVAVSVGSLARRMFPHWLVMLNFVACFLVTKFSLTRLLLKLDAHHVQPASTTWTRMVIVEHISVGASMAIGLLALAYLWAERDYVILARKMWIGHLD